MDSAEADAAIRRLPRRLRCSPLVPGGGLQAHEGSAGHRGHTIGKHVNKTHAELALRFQDDPNLKWSSSFTDRQVAAAAIAHALDNNHGAVRNWLAQSWPTYRFVVDVGADIGRDRRRTPPRQLEKHRRGHRVHRVHKFFCSLCK